MLFKLMKKTPPDLKKFLVERSSLWQAVQVRTVCFFNKEIFCIDTVRITSPASLESEAGKASGAVIATT